MLYMTFDCQLFKVDRLSNIQYVLTTIDKLLFSTSYFLSLHINSVVETITKTTAMGGHAVPIILAGDDHTFTLDEDALAEILLRDEVKDRNVVVVSVAGAFRKGKSFLLDFFLRYMHSKVTIRF